MGAPALSRLLTPIQRQPGIIPAIREAFRVAHAIIALRLASHRRPHFATGPTLQLVPNSR